MLMPMGSARPSLSFPSPCPGLMEVRMMAHSIIYNQRNVDNHKNRTLPDTQASPANNESTHVGYSMIEAPYLKPIFLSRAKPLLSSAMGLARASSRASFSLQV